MLVFLLFILVETISVSCNLFCPCGCFSESPKQIDILSWQLVTVSDKYEELDPGTLHAYNQVVKVLFIDERNLVFNRELSNGLPYGSVYACSPAPIQAIQTIASIEIKSNSETAYLNATDIIKVGDPITDRFVMSLFFDKSLRPVHEFINSLVLYDQDKYQLRLKEKPFQETNLNFDVIITLSDGKVFELKNEMLLVN